MFCLINQLPIEILLAIISFAIPIRPLVETPRQCIRFSWVCRRWRLAVTNNAIFWKYLVLNERMTIPLLQTFIERSKTTSLEILLQDSEDKNEAFITVLRAEAVSSRVKTLYVQTEANVSQILRLLPSLEYIFFAPDFTNDITPYQLPNWFQPKALQIPVRYFDDLNALGQLHELRWLNIPYTNLIPFRHLLKALQTLPNLQVLHFSVDNDEFEFETSFNPTDPIITLHELKVLITEYCSILPFVNAPKLLYLDAFMASEVDDECGHFGGYDFPRITHLRSVLDDDGKISILGLSGSRDISRCFTFNRTCEADKSIFDEIPTVYPNQFRISTADDCYFDDPPELFESNLVNFIITGRFRELHWLDLNFPYSISFLSLLKALESLPNLQVLKLCSVLPSYIMILTTLDPDLFQSTNPRTIILHELKVLIMEDCPILHLIDAPKLSYMDVIVHQEDEGYGHFAGFDFSRITHICTTLDVNECPFIMGKNVSTLSEDVLHFPFNRSVQAFGSIFDEIPISYPNQFYVSFEEGYLDDTPITPITTCLEKSTNLVELVMNKLVTEDDSNDFLDYEIFSSFLKPLIGKESIRTFTIFSGNRFNILCNFLSNHRVCPNLEKLSYSNGNNAKWMTSSDLCVCLSKLMEKRTTTGSTPLEVELAGFDLVQSSRAIEQVEKLGLRLIQKQTEGKPMFFGRKRYFQRTV